MDKQKLLDQLNATHIQTMKYFELPKGDQIKTYQEGKWTVKELLHHIADAETVLYDRIKRGISKPNQVVWAFDQDAWHKGLSYTSMPLEINKSIFDSIRKAIIRLVEIHYDHAEQFEYVHSRSGLRTVKDEMEKVAKHNQGHLEQITRSLQK